jgi:hypothetical protein
VDVALIKSILSVFDHYGKLEGNNFVRSAEFGGVRDFIKRTVQNEYIDGAEWLKYCWGIQYEVENTVKKYTVDAGLSHGRFDHIIILSANPPTRTVDAVFVVAGVDPYCFRLYDNWRGRAFTKVFVHPVFKNTNISGPVELPRTSTLFGKSNRRPILGEDDEKTSTLEHAKQVVIQRSIAINDAALIVENHTSADAYLIEAFIELSTNVYPDLSLSEILAERVKLWYDSFNEIQLNMLEEFLINEFMAVSHEYFEKFKKTEEESSIEEWRKCIFLYRSILSRVVDKFGKPKILNEQELLEDSSFTFRVDERC